MKRVDITKDNGGFKFEVRKHHIDEPLETGSGFATMAEAVEAVEELGIHDDYFVVAADTSKAAEDAVTTLAQQEGVRVANYETSDDGDGDSDLNSQARIETLD